MFSGTFRNRWQPQHSSSLSIQQFLIYNVEVSLRCGCNAGGFEQSSCRNTLRSRMQQVLQTTFKTHILALLLMCSDPAVTFTPSFIQLY